MENRKIKVGLVGLSADHVWFMADDFAAHPNIELTCCAEEYPELRERAMTRYHLAAQYEDYRKMLDSETLDAIVINTDNASKADVTEEAAKRGIHVCIDKPMSATLEQADRIVAAEAKWGIKVMVAYHPWFGWAYNQAKSWVQAGKIGNIYLARGIIGHTGPKELPCSKYFCEWLHDKTRNGGGAFIDEACYTLSQMMDFLGPVTEISGFMCQMGWRDYLAPEMEDNSVAILRFKSGALGMIDSKWGQIGPMPFGNSYHGTDGTVLMGRNGLQIYSRTEMPADMVGWVDVPTPRGAGGRGAGEGAHFVKHILEDKPFEGAVSAKAGRDVQAAIDAFYRSAASGKAEKVDI